jgi:hypothetical protein
MVNAATTTVLTAALVVLLQGATGPPASGGERHLRLQNDTREPIVEIHVSDAGAGRWQGDLLGADFLSPGNSVLVEIDDGNGRCRVDVKMVLDDGTDIVDRGVDVCGGYTVSVR